MTCEPCTCLPAQAADFSPTLSLDTSQSPPWNMTLIAAESCDSAPTTDGSPACTCTKSTSGCSIHPNTPGAWIASMRDSLAPIFQWLERERESTAMLLGSGAKLRGSLASFDPDTCFWRTAQQSLDAGLDACLETWPRSGMTRAGVCYPLPTSAPPTSANAGGALRNVPTPTVNGNNNRKGISPKAGDGLATWVKKNSIPTPAAQDAKNSTLPPSPKDRDSIPGYLLRNGETAGSELNPQWVEWLQGWPIGWTESER